MASKKNFLGSVSDSSDSQGIRQPWYQKWWNKIRSGRKISLPNQADLKMPGNQRNDHHNTRMYQLDNNQHMWYWHQQNWNEQLSSSSNPLPILTELNQEDLKKNSTGRSGSFETGIQQTNVTARDNVPDSHFLKPSQDFKENTGRDDNWMPDATDHQSPETYSFTDVSPDFCSDVYCSDSFSSMD